MSHIKQDFLGYIRKGRLIIDGFKDPKLHMIYEVTIAYIINKDTRHPHRVEIPNSLYVPNRCEYLINPQHWS